MRRGIGMAVAAALLIAAAPHSGGWSVVTVRELPTHLVAGAPTTITFSIRQHGEELRRGHTPTVTIKRPGALLVTSRQRVRAEPTMRPGEYQATITPRDAGQAVVTIDPEMYGQPVDLLPLTVIAAGATPPTQSAEARGRDLFVAKGCVTCHLKADDAEMFERSIVRAGPDLTGRRFDVEWLTIKITDPSINRARFSNNATMPTLELNRQEVAALVAYVNQRVVASR